MKTKTYYIAEDGAELETETAVKRRNLLLSEIKMAIAPLGPNVKDRGSRFANGEGYRQHDLKNVLKAKKALIAIAKREVPDKIWNNKAEDIHPMSFAARLLDECSPTLYREWQRFMCIDEKGREWGQPFFALNPDKGTQREWS